MTPLLPHERSLTACAQAIAAGDVSAEAVTRAALERIEAQNPLLNAYLHVAATSALQQARAVDQTRAAGEMLGPLAGVPISVKDLIAVQGMPLTAGSRILQGYTPPRDATVVQRLRAAGAVILGKTNLDEFAMGSSNEASAYGAVRNPWNTQRVPGGSSGGAAAAVAAGLGVAALGTDTGGSIRQPAALCGIVGLKPTYGRVSRLGVVAYASSLDQVGPMTRTVRDAARLLQVIGGPDPDDATSDGRTLPDLEADLDRGVAGLRVGVPHEFLDGAQGLDVAVRTRINSALLALQVRGATLVPVALPHTRHTLATYYLIATAEASANLARYDGVRFGRRAEARPSDGIDDLYARSRGEGFGTEVKRRILLGTFALSAGYRDAWYDKACRVRRLIHDDFDRAWQTCDVLAGPTSPVVAWKLGEFVQDPLAMYLMDVFTLGVNLAGLPALSLPVGLHPDTLPVGLQLIGRPFDEATLLRAGAAVEADAGTLEPPRVPGAVDGRPA
ncbi:MAG: Asp-tRNA(Asn)/Glu-tRNA(Gln) amidotransferase subunit GatA [Myxococcota bacterium]|jgi:aspartyl-tRNA(Asn)/glutamyl-tRNA(Gln) amidotransferase subunit A